MSVINTMGCMMQIRVKKEEIEEKLGFKLK